MRSARARHGRVEQPQGSIGENVAIGEMSRGGDDRREVENCERGEERERRDKKT